MRGARCCADPGCGGAVARGSYCTEHALRYYDLTREAEREGARLARDAVRAARRDTDQISKARARNAWLDGDAGVASTTPDRAVAFASTDGGRRVRRTPTHD